MTVSQTVIQSYAYSRAPRRNVIVAYKVYACKSRTNHPATFTDILLSFAQTITVYPLVSVHLIVLVLCSFATFERSQGKVHGISNWPVHDAITVTSWLSHIKIVNQHTKASNASDWRSVPQIYMHSCWCLWHVLMMMTVYDCIKCDCLWMIENDWYTPDPDHWLINWPTPRVSGAKWVRTSANAQSLRRNQSLWYSHWYHTVGADCIVWLNCSMPCSQRSFGSHSLLWELMIVY